MNKYTFITYSQSSTLYNISDVEWRIPIVITMQIWLFLKILHLCYMKYLPEKELKTSSNFVSIDAWLTDLKLDYLVSVYKDGSIFSYFWNDSTLKRWRNSGNDSLFFETIAIKFVSGNIQWIYWFIICSLNSATLI